MYFTSIENLSWKEKALKINIIKKKKKKKTFDLHIRFNFLNRRIDKLLNSIWTRLPRKEKFHETVHTDPSNSQDSISTGRSSISIIHLSFLAKLLKFDPKGAEIHNFSSATTNSITRGKNFTFQILNSQKNSLSSHLNHPPLFISQIIKFNARRLDIFQR